jgi:flagellar protein FliS
MAPNPYLHYQRVRVETADQGRLLLMLYEGALRFLGRARKSLHDRDLEGANNNLLRVGDIVSELIVSLDLEKGGEIATALFRLYDYIYHLLLEANIKKDPEPLDDVEKMLLELRAAWKVALGETKGSGGAEKQVQDFPGGGREVLLEEENLFEDKKVKYYNGYEGKIQEEKILQGVFNKLNITR